MLCTYKYEYNISLDVFIVWCYTFDHILNVFPLRNIYNNIVIYWILSFMLQKIYKILSFFIFILIVTIFSPRLVLSSEYPCQCLC